MKGWRWTEVSLGLSKGLSRDLAFKGRLENEPARCRAEGRKTLEVLGGAERKVPCGWSIMVEGTEV